jgi:hypothetical protein
MSVRMVAILSFSTTFHDVMCSPLEYVEQRTFSREIDVYGIISSRERKLVVAEPKWEYAIFSRLCCCELETRYDSALESQSVHYR